MGLYFLPKITVEVDVAYTRCPVTPTFLKGGEPLSKKDSKTKEERLWEMFINNYITETDFYKMLERIRKEK
jgi:hypothetical protein